MSTFAIRRPRLVVALWLVAVAASFTVGLGVFDRLVSDVGLVPGSESDRAEALMDDMGPQPMTLTAIVHGRPVADPAVREQVAAALADVRALPGVVSVADPIPS